MEERGKPVTEEDMEATYAVPTALVNRFIINSNQDGFRFAFGESRSDESPVHFRIAVKMSVFDAYQLREVLNRLLEPFEPSIIAAMEKAQEDATRDKS